MACPGAGSAVADHQYGRRLGLYYARAYDQAAEQLRHTLELDSNFVVAHLILGLASAQQNRTKEAIEP